MANKPKEKCPYCGKEFVALNRHKCKKAPKEESVKTKPDSVIDKLDRYIEPKKIIDKESILSKVDLKSDKTLRFLSKFINLELVYSNSTKTKKIIKDILDSSINIYNFLNEEELKILEECFKLSKIDDYSKLDSEDIYKTISASEYQKFLKYNENIPDLEIKLKKVISFSSILKGIKDKSVDIEKEQQKVAVTGLDKAGKTALLMKFAGNLGIDLLSKLKPTYGVERVQIETEDMNLFVWDFGGQESYRKSYLARPEQYFLECALLIYVIDIQDWERFEESFDYLAKILDILQVLEEYPEVMIYLHKFDPDIREDPDVLLNVQFVEDVLKDMFQERPYSYETYLTSIYSSITKEAQFSKFIKTMVDEGSFVANPKIDKLEALGQLIDNALNSFIKLSESVSRQFNEVNARLDLIEGAIRAGGGSIKLPATTATASTSSGLKPPPPPPPPPDQAKIPVKVVAVQSVRSAIMSELKDLFTRVRGKNE